MLWEIYAVFAIRSKNAHLKILQGSQRKTWIRKRCRPNLFNPCINFNWASISQTLSTIFSYIALLLFLTINFNLEFLRTKQSILFRFCCSISLTSPFSPYLPNKRNRSTPRPKFTLPHLVWALLRLHSKKFLPWFCHPSR